tara:strand:+ start:4893 stop:5618 length:726 start_codon:yes stop_codon:yes gene_type:complete
MSNGNYTWEQVMYGIDVGNEAADERQQILDIERKRKQESNMMSTWSLGLSILGGVLFGPVGYAAGKILGRQGADWGWFGGDYSDWEEMEVSEGKWDKQASRNYNRALDDAALEQSKGQSIAAITDLATMYIQAGGLKEGFDAGSWREWTTFGTGEDAWSVFGKGEVGGGSEKLIENVLTFDDTGAGTIDVRYVANPDYKPYKPAVPSIFEGGFKPLGSLKDLWGQSPVDKITKPEEVATTP